MRSRIRREHLAAIVLSLLIVSAVSCRRADNLPQKGSKEYNEAVRTFFIGLAALQVGHDIQADAKLAQMTQLVPDEPAGWANWGVLALRQRNYEQAFERFERARALAPDNDQISYLIGLLESSRGKQTESIAALRKAVQLNPQNLIAAFQLAQEVERDAGENSEAEFQQLISQILKAQPRNLAALLDLARIAAKRGDAETLRDAVARISSESASWPDEVKQQLSTFQTAASGADPRAAATRAVFLRNVLVRVPQYRQDLSLLKPPPGEEAVPFTSLLRLATPTFGPAAPDVALSFNTESVSQFSDGNWMLAAPIYLGSSGSATIMAANGDEVRLSTGAKLPFPGGSAKTPPGPDGVLPVDFTYDFKTDLVLAGAGGVRLIRQDSPTAFSDVTTQTNLPSPVTSAPYLGAWAVDIEADGDLDVLLGTQTGAPPVLRNNGDGSFLEIHPFEGISGLRGFVWADLDADGDSDVSSIDATGRLHVFTNQRQGQFAERPLPANLPLVKAINVADIDNDSGLDLIIVQGDGNIIRLSDKTEGQEWTVATIASISDGANKLGNEIRLRVADLDNNGGLDLLLVNATEDPSAPGALLWLATEKNELQAGQPVSLAKVFDSCDLNGDGRLDLVGLSNSGQVMQAVNRSSKNYHWQVVRPRASQATGDQRINPFGIGGEMEVRSGLMLQKQQISGPLLHFGLGEQTSADVIRVIWPNGSVQAEFEARGDEEFVAEQRLKGSCPFLFAYNGKEMEFVKDAVPWGPAIGLRINTLGSAKIATTGEWFKIGREQLVPRDGYYDLRLTAELWEVYYYDYVALMPVDHPVGTEIYVDERFVVPPLKLGLTTVSTPQGIEKAVDDTGTDVTNIVTSLDGKTVDTFGHGQYQGLTRDHFLEVSLGEGAPSSGPLYLIAHGSVLPTDSSLNVALSQGSRWQARGMSLEVPDAAGGWTEAQSNLGFPAGRKKTVLFNLTDVFRPDTPRKVRIRTNLEIYWDKIEWARGAPDAPVITKELSASVADLHFRGYSLIERPAAGAPEIPDYNRLSGSTQVWRDLIGYYTRHGEVGELLERIDDRYVIVAAGDEMSLRFPELPPPPAGWIRDFVIMGDGWIKDGDYNSTFSKTVLPLPYHAKQEYTTAPTKLEDEWVYKRYPDDWQKYHTRYITPDVFRNALRTRKP